MNTPAHLIINVALLAGGARRRQLRWVVSGALLPDLGMFAFFAYEFWVAKTPMRVIWDEHYFDPAWQTFFDLFNSLPLLGLGFLVAWFMRRKGWALLCVSAALHAMLDLPVHREDGHRHFWPISDWRYMSPVSYWDPEHGGALGSLLELLLMAGASVVIWRRYRYRVLGAALLLLNGASLVGWLLF